MNRQAQDTQVEVSCRQKKSRRKHQPFFLMGMADLPRDPLSCICSRVVSLMRSECGPFARGQYGSWLGPLRLTSKELRGAADLLVTRLYLNASDITEDELERQLQAFPHLSYIHVEVPDTAPEENIALLKTLPNVKALDLCDGGGSSLSRDVVCPASLLEGLPSMTALQKLWWGKSPSELELKAMQLLPNLQCLGLSSYHRSWRESEMKALAGLTRLTRLGAAFRKADATPLLQLTRLVVLKVHKARVPRSLLCQVLTQFPCLSDLRWDVGHDPLLDAKYAAPPISMGTAGQLTRLECAPLDAQACCALGSLAFPLLQHFDGWELPKDVYDADLIDCGLAWFPRMCRSSLALTSLELSLGPTHHTKRPSNICDGIALLANLKSLQLCFRTFDYDASPLHTFVGAQTLAGLTRLTRLWVESVVHPCRFDREVRALSELKALREVVLCEKSFLLISDHIPSAQDKVISKEALVTLLAALPNLRRFVVMGGWVDLGRPGWAGTRVTPQGQIAVQSLPWLPKQVGEDRNLKNMRSFFAGDFFGKRWLVLDVLETVSVRTCGV